MDKTTPKKKKSGGKIRTITLEEDYHARGTYTNYLDKAKKNHNMEKEKLSAKKRNPKDYELGPEVASGAYGKVLLAKDKHSGNFVAVKVLNKKYLVDKRNVSHIIAEKNILACIDFPFFVSLTGSFKTSHNLFISLEYITGGEMFDYIEKYGHFGETTTLFYASQVILAFEYLHHLDIAYRDLKPENILIASNGYCRITDFGFAKYIEGRTWTSCGTTEYMAPEILRHKGHGKAVDWWCLGILMYEMAIGYTPYSDEENHNDTVVIKKILENAPPNFDNAVGKKLTANFKDLVTNLVKDDLTRRYGNLQRGVNDIKQHELFKTGKGFPWDQIFHQRHEPPIKPMCVPPEKKWDPQVTDVLAKLEQPGKNKNLSTYEKEFADF